MYYTVGQMAQILNIAPSALRYYDREGLLPFVERTEGGIRMFKDSDYEWLHLIECLKKTGMSIKDIKRYIDLCLAGDSSIEQRAALMQSQRESVLRQIAQMQETLATLDYKCWYYEMAKAAGTCDGLDNLQLEDVPEALRSAYIKCKSSTDEV